MKKRSSIIAVVLCVSMLASACGSQSNSDSSEYSAGNRKQIDEAEYQEKLDSIEPTAYSNVYGLDLEPGTYLSILGIQENGAYWEEIQRGIRQATDDINTELGYDGKDKVKVTFNAPSTPGDVDEQVNILDEELSREPEAVAVSLADIQSGEVQFDLAIENDIPIVAFDSGSDYQGLMATVSTDNNTATAEVAVKMAEDMDDFGEIIIFAHDSKSLAAINRVEAFTSEIEANHSHITIVDTYAMDQLEEMQQTIADEMNAEADTDISTENDTDADIEEGKVEAADITEEEVIDYILSKHPNVKGIFATDSEAMALALSGCERLEMNTSRISIMGFDLGDGQMDALQNGEIDGVILQNPFGMGYAAVVAAARAALDMANEAVVDTGYVWVTGDNLEEPDVQKMLY